MSGNQLAITNVINISVSQSQTGIGQYNTSNLGLFTSDTPDGSFGDDGYKIYLSPQEVAVDFGTDSITYAMSNAIFSQAPNILAGNGYLVIIPFEASETLAAAITRTEDLVQYFGVMSTQIETEEDMLDAAAVIQALNKIAFFVQRAAGSIEPAGSLDLLTTGSFTQSRGLYYGSDNDDDALVMQASYAGRALSTNFEGSNTTQTMHLKDLVGVQPDPSMTQTLLNKAQAAGADVYVSLQGVAKVFSSGANSFFDQVYNLRWLVGALQVAGFNYLAQSSTKIPQTEDGMDGLKGAYRNICEQAVANQYSAPGQWNSSTTFGNQQNFLQNITQRGYYIYSAPISKQSQSSREARTAPLVQIALKEAGAIQKSNVIVYVNA
jgi:hypothetical protein